MLQPDQISQFIEDGFTVLPGVVPAEICGEVREIIWKDTGVDRNDPSSWIHPVIRLGDYAHEPFRAAANLRELHEAFDQLIGKGNWLPRGSLGTFPVRFPGGSDPGDTGWHVDASFAGDDPNDFFSWRTNVFSDGRALLMLFLFSDVGEPDAPTRILRGSHIHIARMLAPYGKRGKSFREMTSLIEQLPSLPESVATGSAGTVYLCHPFLVHAAQAHHGITPKIMAQPPLQLRGQLDLSEMAEPSPLATTIKKALL